MLVGFLWVIGIFLILSRLMPRRPPRKYLCAEELGYIYDQRKLARLIDEHLVELSLRDERLRWEKIRFSHEFDPLRRQCVFCGIAQEICYNMSTGNHWRCDAKIEEYRVPSS